MFYLHKDIYDNACILYVNTRITDDKNIRACIKEIKMKI